MEKHPLGSTFRKIPFLCQKMTSFVQTILYYLTTEVLELNWRKFEAQLSTVENIDQVLYYHEMYLENCLKECLLKNQEILIVSFFFFLLLLF